MCCFLVCAHTENRYYYKGYQPFMLKRGRDEICKKFN